MYIDVILRFFVLIVASPFLSNASKSLWAILCRLMRSGSLRCPGSRDASFLGIRGCANSTRQDFEGTAMCFEKACESVFSDLGVTGTVTRIGSFFSGIDIEGSDLDFSISAPELFADEEDSLLDSIDRGYEDMPKKWESAVASNCLFRFKSNLAKQGLLPNSKSKMIGNRWDCLYDSWYLIGKATPVLMLEESVSGIKIDVVFNGFDSENNSLFLKEFAEGNIHFQPLCRAFKRWADVYEVTNAKKGRLNCFSLCLMVICFLKKFPVSAEFSTAQLFFELIEFYSNFDFQNKAISAVDGKTYLRGDEIFNSNQVEKRRDLIVILDPYKERWNCAATVKDKAIFEEIVCRLKQLRRSLRCGTVFFEFEHCLQPLIEVDIANYRRPYWEKDSFLLSFRKNYKSIIEPKPAVAVVQQKEFVPFQPTGNPGSFAENEEWRKSYQRMKKHTEEREEKVEEDKDTHQEKEELDEMDW